MTDGYAEDGARDDAGPARSTLVLGGGLAVVLLAAIGAAGGWILAGEDGGPGAPLAAATATGSPTASESARPTPERSTPAAPRTTAPRPTGLTVPPVIGTDFEGARDELRERRLGWRLVFGRGSGRAVERTYPEVGTEVSPGRTVTLYVTGPAPAATVPDLIGEECDEAADELVEEGFYPRYPLGRTGTVSRQDPPGDSAGRWNDRISIWCGDVPTASPSTSPTP